MCYWDGGIIILEKKSCFKVALCVCSLKTRVQLNVNQKIVFFFTKNVFLILILGDVKFSKG